MLFVLLYYIFLPSPQAGMRAASQCVKERRQGYTSLDTRDTGLAASLRGDIL